MAKIKFYLENESERKNKIEELRKIVLKKHTYHIRALAFKKCGASSQTCSLL